MAACGLQPTGGWLSRWRRRLGAIRRRGVAMLLVLLSLGMATIVTGAYLASRDNSATIGASVADSAAARWAADTGLDMAVAVLQTETDWRSATQGHGKLLDDYATDNGIFDVDLTDLATGGTPTSVTEHVLITSTGLANGIQQIATAVAHVPLVGGDVVDVDLSEFAVFVGSGLNMANQSIITRWPMAPLSTLGEQVALGTQATSAGSVTLANPAAAIDAVLYHGPGASNALVSNAASPPLRDVALLDQMPLPAPPTSGEVFSALTTTDLTQNGGSALVIANSRYRNVELKSGAVRTLRGSISAISDQDYKINSNAKLLIDGNVKMVVFGRLELDSGSIELKPGARLRLYVRGTSSSTAVTIRDSYIGNLRTDNLRDNTGEASWMDPQRITLFSMTPVSSPCEWRLENNSVVKGSIYAPHASGVVIANTSAVYGRIATAALHMTDDAALFYDHALDARCGYTEPSSPLFAADGHIKLAFRTLTSLDMTALQAAADTAVVTIKYDTGSKWTCVPAGAVAEIPPAVLPTDPTPRPVQVDYTILALGSNVKTWESAH